MIEDILDEVLKERVAQDNEFGENPRGESPSKWLSVLVEEVGEYATDVNDKAFENGRYTENMRYELIQVAAVAIAAIEDLDYQDSQKDEW